jgi:hypothetical protein
MKKFCAWFGLMLLLALLAVISASPGWAGPEAQVTPFLTPTPGPDGRIIYIVQPNDKLWTISALAGVSLEELRALNNIVGEAVIVPGQELLLGYGGPAEQESPSGSITPAAEPTETATPLPGYGTLCVLLFEDFNGDAMRQEEEPAIPGGAISVSDRYGQVSRTADTIAGFDPVCFEELPEGEYNISVAIPEGYNPTTLMNYALELHRGDETYLDFGGQNASLAIASAPTSSAKGRSPLMGLVGGLLLAAGIGLGIYTWRRGK